MHIKKNLSTTSVSVSILGEEHRYSEIKMQTSCTYFITKRILRRYFHSPYLYYFFRKWVNK